MMATVREVRKEYMRLYRNLQKRINYADKQGLSKLNQVKYLKTFKSSTKYNDASIKFKLRELQKAMKSEKYKTKELRKRKQEYIDKWVELGGDKNTWELQQDLFAYLQSIGLLEQYYSVLSIFFKSDAFYKSKNLEEAFNNLRYFREREYKEAEEHPTTMFDM